MVFIQKLLATADLESLRRLYDECLPYKRRILLVLFLGLLIAAIQPVCVKFSQQIIDELRANGKIEFLQRIAWMLVGLFAVSGLAKYFHNTLRRGVNENIVIKIRGALYKKYLGLPLPELEKKRTGDLLSKMQNDLAQISAGLDTVFDVLREPFTFMGLLGIAFYCDWQLTLITLVVAPAVFYLFSRCGFLVKRYSERNLGQFSDLMSLGQETLVGARVVKVFQMEAALMTKFRQIQERFLSTMLKSIRVQELATPAVEFIGAILMALVILYGGYRTTQGYLTAGELIAFIIAIGLVQMPIKKLNSAYMKLKMAEAAVERVYGVLETEIVSEYSLHKPVTHVSTLLRDIEFRNVGLCYGEKRALENVSFKIERGEIAAFVGHSGGGKSSIVNLLPRLYVPTEGSILFDGVSTEEMSLAELRRLISFVTQDTFLFNDSIYENIRYGRPSASQKEIERAAEQAHCLDFIAKCPQGYQSFIGDRGMQLSGGERQRVAIARAILKDSPILVLDEATSNLDSRSERVVQVALEELMVGKTTFLVAHRFSTVLHADKIFVMEGGRITEQGTHDELVHEGGIYAGLYQHQVVGRS